MLTQLQRATSARQERSPRLQRPDAAATSVVRPARERVGCRANSANLPISGARLAKFIQHALAGERRALGLLAGHARLLRREHRRRRRLPARVAAAIAAFAATYLPR